MFSLCISFGKTCVSTYPAFNLARAIHMFAANDTYLMYWSAIAKKKTASSSAESLDLGMAAETLQQ